VSLRAFHLFFITVAALSSFAFAAWALLSRGAVAGAPGYCALGLAGGLLLAFWGRSAARRLQQEEA
jgi:fluoride ion exporter CrcB/FEX